VFEHAWAAPECSPTRSTLISGLPGFATGVGAAADRLDPGVTSLQEVFADGSPHPYATAVIGKWHLAGANSEEYGHPAELGVEHYAGLFGGGLGDYFRWTKIEEGAPVVVDEYATTTFTDDAIAWIDDQEGPWFLWLAYTAPHTPFHLPPAELHDRDDLTGTAADIRARPRDYYFAAAEALDAELGRLLDQLPEEVRARTVILFLGDNGTPGMVAQAPYDADHAKGSLYEGGIRVPLVIAGPPVQRPGAREAALVASIDLFATIAELAGADNPRAETSFSLLPFLAGPAGPVRSIVHSEYFRGDEPQDTDNPEAFGWTVRDDHLQLIVLDGGDPMLYDLDADPESLEDLASSPEHAADLARLEAAGRALRGE
jgi:arylsulfatase A-like enzyme